MGKRAVRRVGHQLAPFSRWAAKRGCEGNTTMLMMLLLVVLVLALFGGAVGHSRFGYAGWSPAGILVLVLLVWFFMGNRI
jgi:hypothetical protein